MISPTTLERDVTDDLSNLAERLESFMEAQREAHGTWRAKRALAASLRELLDCICATDADEDELLRSAREIRETARRFAVQPPMIEQEGVAEMAFAGMASFHDRSPIVGLSNPLAPPLELVPDREHARIVGNVTFGSAYEGGPGLVHGGMVAAAFDEVLGMACIYSGNPGMTGTLSIRYERPTPLKVPLRFEGRFDRVEGRRVHTVGEVSFEGQVTARATGVFVTIPPETFQRFDEERRERAGRT